MVRQGSHVLILTYYRPLLRATHEVNQLHPSGTCWQLHLEHSVLEPRTSWREFFCRNHSTRINKLDVEHCIISFNFFSMVLLLSMCESEKFAEQIKWIKANRENRVNQLEQIKLTSTTNRANCSLICSANWANNTNKWVNICPISVNWTNIYLFIHIICPIHPANWFDSLSESQACRANRANQKSNQVDLMIRPIREGNY